MHNSSQEDVFAYCATDIIQNVVEGFNGTVMVYGQTGAGKTFTMSGSPSNYKYRGIIPRSVSQLFQEIGSRFDQQITIRVSYVEVYNELLFDLLSDTPTHEQSGDISIQEGPDGEISVKGLSMHVVANEEEALNMLFEGDTNKTVSSHLLNKQSSRSHCIFTLHVESKSRVESSEKVVRSKLHLVDLAGSERTKKTNPEGITLKEAAFINKSLSFLEQVVVAVCDRNRSHVPYRQSKLTNMLKDSIGGNCKTLMIANVWPEPSHIEETISTLKFATRMMRVSNEAIVNVHQDPELLIRKYEREVRDLKQELAMHDTLANRGRINYDPYTPEQQYEIQKQAQAFLDGEQEDIEEINSLRQVRELFNQMRIIYRKMEQNAKTLSSRHGEGDGGVEGDGEINAEMTRRQTIMKEGGVGDEEEGNGGFGIGIAPKDSKPTNKIESKPATGAPQEEESQADEGEGEGEGGAQDEEEKVGTASRKKKEKKEFKTRQDAYQEFKAEDGVNIEEGIRSNRADLKTKKDESQLLKESCNAAKKEMDSIKVLLDQKQDEKQKTMDLDVDEEVIDEEEFALIK